MPNNNLSGRVSDESTLTRIIKVITGLLPIIMIMMSVFTAFVIIKVDAATLGRDIIAVKQIVSYNEKGQECINKRQDESISGVRDTVNLLTVEIGRFRETQLTTNEAVNKLSGVLNNLDKSIGSIQIFMARFDERLKRVEDGG